MTVATQTMTAEEFWKQYSEDDALELVRGEVRPTMPPGGEHAGLALRLGSKLLAWADEGRGWAGVEGGFLVGRNPDTVRGPDIAFVRAERIPASGVPRNFWPFTPDLAVEVISPSERVGDIEEKVGAYLSGGTRLVWLVYPGSKRVFAYSSDDEVRIFGAEDILEDETVLSGFRCKVGDIFK